MADGATIGLLGASKLASATDGTNTASGTCTIAPATGWAYTTLAGTLNTSNTSLLFNGVPAAVVGDQIVGETAKITLYSTLDAETSYVGTQTLYHIAASDGIWRSFTLTTGNAGGSNVTYTLTGLSTTSSNGLVVGLSSGIIKTITGLSTTASNGTISGISGGIKYVVTGLQSVASTGIITQLGAGVTYLITGLSTIASQGSVLGSSGGIIKTITGLSTTAATGTISGISGGIKYLVTGVTSTTTYGFISSNVGTLYTSSGLPTLITSVKKSIKKSVRSGINYFSRRR